MTRRVAKRQLRRGLSLQEPAPEEPQMDYEEEEDDLADLLEEEPPMEEPMPEEEDDMMLAEINNLYKAVDERDDMILQLARGMQKLAKRVLVLEDDDEDDEDSSKEDKAARRVAKGQTAPRKVQNEAPEGDFTVGGDDDLGDEIQQGGDPQEPGLTAGNPQGIAQKAVIAKALSLAGVDAAVIKQQTGLVFKDDKWSNYGDKDSDIPANAPVTPDTKDWDEDFGIVPGSGNAPSSVKGIGSVSKSLEKLGVDTGEINKMFETAGFIRKAAAPTVGAGATADGAQPIEQLEERARGLTFGQLNDWRLETGNL